MTPPERPDLNGAASALLCVSVDLKDAYENAMGETRGLCLDNAAAASLGSRACVLLNRAPSLDALNRAIAVLAWPEQDVSNWLRSVAAFLEGGGTP